MSANVKAVLDGYYRRFSNLVEERNNVSQDIRELFVEIKGNGLNAKAMRKAFAERQKSEKDEGKYRAEREDLDLYLAELGL